MTSCLCKLCGPLLNQTFEKGWIRISNFLNVGQENAVALSICKLSGNPENSILYFEKFL